MSQKRESLSFCVLVCLMSSLFGLGGAGYLAMVIEQARTLGYAEAQGTITASQITDSQGRNFNADDPEGTSSSSYNFKVLYTYEVGGRSYTGRQVFHGFIVGDLDMALALSERFPLNARVPVYYSTDNPSQPVLLRAPEGINLLIVLTSFALLAAMGWSGYALIQEVRRRSRGVLTVVREGRTHVRWGLGLRGWFMWMSLCLLLSYLLSAELILSLSWGEVVLFFVVLIAASVFVESRRQARIRSGALDVVLDGQGGVLSFPSSLLAGRRNRFQLPLSRIERLYVEQDPAGMMRKNLAEAALFLTTNDEVSPLKIPAVTWLFEDKLEALWNWLKRRPELKHVLFTPP